jgi:hypothetical protein
MISMAVAPQSLFRYVYIRTFNEQAIDTQVMFFPVKHWSPKAHRTTPSKTYGFTRPFEYNSMMILQDKCSFTSATSDAAACLDRMT